MNFENGESMLGNTPNVRVQCDEVNADLWMKLEGYNPAGSVKDRGCIAMIRDAIKHGTLKPGMTLLDASSGNMACAHAFFGSVMGYKVELACGSKLTEDKKKFIEYFGAKLHLVGNITYEGYLYCRDQLLPKSPDKYCFFDQLHNWANPQGYYESLGPEIQLDFEELTAVVGSLGSGGHMCGLAEFFIDNGNNVQLIATEAEAGTKLPGVGSFISGDYITPFIQKAFDLGYYIKRYRVHKEEAYERMRQLHRQGIFCGTQAGAVYSVAIRAAKELDLHGNILMIAGDSGWKNMETIHSLYAF